MKRLIYIFAIVAWAAMALSCFAGYSTDNYTEQGGSRDVIGGSLDIVSGGEIDIESGGAWKIVGTAVTSSAAELNLLTGSTAGTAVAGAAVVVDTNKAVDMLRMDYLYLYPDDTSPGHTKGYIYFSDSNNCVEYWDGSAVVQLTAGTGDNTLDNAYDQGGNGAGRTITADTGAVVITNTDADTAFVLELTPTPGSSAALGGLKVTVGANSTEDAIQVVNSGSGDDIQAGGGAFTVSAAGAVATGDITATGDVSVSGTLTAGTLYQAAIASAAAGDVAINIDGAGTGQIIFGATSSGKITTDNLVELLGNVDLGDTVASDTLSILAKIDTDIYLDDDATDSPSLIFRDDGEDNWAIKKVDGATGNLTVTSNVGTSDFQIVTGNLKVGGGSEGVTLNGEDAYITGTFEVDGSAQFDGAVAINGNLTIAGETSITDQVAMTFATNDEELAISATATDYSADVAIFTITMAAQDNAVYALRLRQTPDADAQGHFIVAEDNAGDDKFAMEAGGTTTWTLDAASIVKIDAETTANTATSGVLEMHVQSATDTSKAIYIDYQLEENAANAYGIYIDLDDDTTGAGEAWTGIYIDNSSAGSADTVKGLVFTNAMDDAIEATMGAAGQAFVIDAATTDHTGTTGVIDIEFDSKTAGAEAINIKATHLTGGSGQEVAGMEIELVADSGNASDLLVGLIINATDTTATGKVDGIQVTGSGIQRAFQSEYGYVQIGTGGSPTETPGDDDLYVEGTAEFDGIVYADAGVELDNTLLMIATVEIANNELEALQGTPKELVAAGGGGTLIEFVSAMIVYDYSGDTLAETDDNLVIEYDGGSAVAASDTIEMTGFIDQGSDQITRAVPVKDAMDAAADIVNKNLVLVNTGDGEFVDGGSDCTSTVTVIITYRLHDTLGL